MANMKGNGARLIDKAERLFDGVSGIGPLGGIECFLGWIADRYVKERKSAFSGASHQIHRLKCFNNTRRSEAPKFQEFGALAVFSGDQIPGEARALRVRNAFCDHRRASHPTRSRMHATAARTSARTAPHSPVVTVAAPALSTRAIWLRLLPTRFSATAATASALASKDGVRCVRGPGLPRAAARRKPATLRPTERAFASMAARSSGRHLTDTGASRCRFSLPLRRVTGNELSLVVNRGPAPDVWNRRRVPLVANSGTRGWMQRKGTPLLAKLSRGKRQHDV